MFKLFLSFVFIALVACNNQSKNTPEASTADSSATATSYKWENDDEKEFLADCVEGAKAKLGDTAAYKRCNCVLKQLQQKFSSLDSAENHLTDSTQVAAYTANCQ